MIKFEKPINLNGGQLLDELAAVGIVLDKFKQAPRIDGNGDFWLDIDSKDEAKVASVVKAHNGITVAPELTPVEKLAAAGLSVDELKALLGFDA